MNISYSHPVRYSRCGGSRGQIVKRQLPASARLTFKPLLHPFTAFIFGKPFHWQPFLASGTVCQRLTGHESAVLWNNSFGMRLIFFIRPSYMRNGPCFPSSAMFYPPTFMISQFPFFNTEKWSEKRFEGVFLLLFLLFCKLLIIINFLFFNFSSPLYSKL